MGGLLDAYTVLKSGTLWSSTGKCKGYAPSDPGEAAQIDAYVAALDAGNFTAMPPALVTPTGRGIVGILRALAVQAAPAPTPPAVAAPFKGCSPGSKITRVTSTDRAWELGEIASCFGPGSVIRIDYYGSGTDPVVQDAVNAGLSPLLVLGGTLATIPAPSVHAAAATAAMTRWKGVCRYLEVGGNEPNLNGQTVAVHAALVNAASAAAKAVDPGVQVLNGGIAPADNTLTFGSQLIPLIKGRIDQFNMHLYEDATVRGAWNNWDRSFHPESLGGQPSLQQVLDSNGMADVPISSTESGGRASDIGETNQAKYVADAYADFAARRAAGEKVGFVLVYAMRDDDVSGWGLCRLDHSHRPAWTFAQNATA